MTTPPWVRRFLACACAVALILWCGLWFAGGVGTTARAMPQSPSRAFAMAPRGPEIVHITAISFVDQRHGWVLGDSLAAPHGPALQQTSDGGRTWQPLPPPPVNVNPWRSALLFVTPRDGWLYGPVLLVTHDGGRTWRRDAQHDPVLALAPLGMTVWSVEQRCAGRCVLRLRQTADLGRT